MSFSDRLKNLDTIKARLDCLTKERERQKSIGVSSYGTSKVQAGRGSPTESEAIRLAALDTRIEALQREYMTERAACIHAIDNLSDSLQVRIIYLRYFDGLQWNTIAEALSYSLASIYRAHAKALTLLDQSDGQSL